MRHGKLLKDHMKYCAEIDGLRAVAVSAVILFHFDLLGVTGGFVGVDVFFVISGFLISSIILNQIGAGTFSLREFYTRRARRILPALSAVLMVVTVGGWFFFLPMALEQLGQAILWVSLSLANVYFWRSSSYFGPAAEEIPLLHCWSLSVEEQFYFVVPLGLLLLARLSWKFNVSSVRSTAFVAGFSWVVSLLAAVYFLQIDKHSAVFYLLPTRAWELLTGMLIALLPFQFVPSGRFIKELVLAVGLSAILLACFTFDETTTFPGWNALLPCLGAACVIVGAFIPSDHKSSIGHLLRSKPMVGCGLISYSLYLWHWPIWVFFQYYQFEPPTLISKIGLLTLCVLVSWLSWRYIEIPFRTKSASTASLRPLRIAFGSVAVFACVGLVLSLADGVPGRYPSSTISLLHVSEPWGDKSHYELDEQDIKLDKINIVHAATSVGPQVLIWGDSHAMAVIPGFAKACQTLDLTCVAATHSSTLPIVGWEQPATRSGLGTRAAAYNQAVLDYIRRHRVPNVFLVANWKGCQSDKAKAWLLETVRLVRESGASVWFVTQVPEHPVDVPKAMARVAIWNEPELKYSAIQTSHELYGRRDQNHPFRQELENAGAKIVETRNAFLDVESNVYRISMNGRILYHDKSHITPFASEMLIAPVIIELLAFPSNALQ